MAKPYQNLLDIMDQLLIEESEPLCRQVAAVFQRFRPECMTELQQKINDWKYGPQLGKMESEPQATGSEFILTQDHFKKKQSGSRVAVSQQFTEHKVIHAGIDEQHKEAIKMPTTKFESIEEMLQYFDGMKLKEIKKFMNENGVPIHNSANADSVFEVLNDSIN